MADTNEQAAFIAGLRAVADFYEANPDMPLPYRPATISTFSVGLVGSDRPGSEFAALVQRLGGHRTKKLSDEYARIVRDFGGGVSVEVWAARDQVCTRTQVGTVKELVPDPNAPLVECEVPVWAYDCDPILAEGDRLVDDLVDAVEEARTERQAHVS